jgi:Circularly permutated YpsA SLOG family
VPRVARIVSGGQSGVDRAALDVARAAGIPYGGWCPKGGWAEDYPSPPGLLADYPALVETPLAQVEQRTRWNARDSDATLVITRAGTANRQSPGTSLASVAADEFNRPCLVVATDEVDPIPRAHAFLESLPRGAVLNIAGPRESEARGIYAETRRLLTAILEIDAGTEC